MGFAFTPSLSFIRPTFLFLLCCLLCILPACSRATSKKSTTVPQIKDHIVLLLEDSSQDDSAELIIVARSSGLEWRLENRSRANKQKMLLRTGVQSAGRIDSIRTELKNALRTYKGSAGSSRYSLNVTCLDHSGAWTSSISGDDPLLWDHVLPRGGPFEVIWAEATGIPKKYWYRDVGPIDKTAREELRPVEKTDP